MRLTKGKNRKLAPTFRSLFDDFWGADDYFTRRFTESPFTNMPAVNIKNNQEDYEIEVAAPGLSKDDFTVSIDGNILNISCEKAERNEEKEDNFTREEFNYSTFSRSFALPDNVDSEDVEATYRDGVLTLKLKKLAVANSVSKTIEIS